MRGQALLAVGALAAALLAAQPAMAQNYGGYQGQPYQGYQGGYVSPQQTIDEAQCSNSKTNRMLGGAAIGAILGAVIGNNVGHHPGQGTLPGAVIGGVAGGAIGRGTAHCNTSNGYQQQGYNDRYNQPPPYQQPYAQDRRYDDRRYDDGRGLDGGPSYHPSSYQGDRGDCRWGTVSVRDPDGYMQNQNVWMCRAPDGQWRPQR